MAILDNPAGAREAEKRLTYDIRFAANNDRLQLIGEKLENILPYQTYQTNPYYYFSVENGYGRISPRRSYDDGRNDYQGESEDEPLTRITPDNFSPTRSVMSQIREPVNFPVLTQTASRLSTMKLYRNWDMGRDSPARKPPSYGW